MKIYRWFVVGITFAWLACSAADGQQSTSKSIIPAPQPIPVNGDAAPVNGTYETPSGGLSDYIVYRRECCEGKPGSWMPFYTELYLRSGASMPVGRQTLSQELENGWSIAGGARALFFNAGLMDAWTVDAHIISTWENASHIHTPFPLTTFVGPVRTDFGTNGSALPPVTVRSSNRTMVGLGLGKEWYIWKPADAPGWHWRVGIDGGGRYGSQRLELNETRHLTDVVGSAFGAIHTDLEYPTHFGMFFTGVRLEWSYTWSDILQVPSDLQELNLFLNVGIRF